MASRFGSILAVVATMILACAGVVMAQPNEPDPEQTTGEELIEPASSLDAGDVIPNRYIVVLKDDASVPNDDASNAAAVASELAQPLGLEVTHTYENALNGFAVRAPDLSLSALDSALSDDDRVDFIAEDRKVQASAQPAPNGIDRVEADQSSTKAGDGNSGVVDADVAILDTGIYNHRDLNRAGGYNCTGKDRKAYGDGNGHGTHVAGTAAAKDNDTGVVGVAPGARLRAVKVLGKDGSGSVASVICGIDWVTGKAGTIEVANMSLGGIGTDDEDCGRTNNDAMHRAICNSVAEGVTYAVAAGNDNRDFANTVPAAYDEVLTVTAMSDSDGKPGNDGPSPACSSSNVDDRFANFSNYATPNSSDAEHTIAAPGVCIKSTWRGSNKNPKGTYKTKSGTSMASPHVAGTAALCIAFGPCTGNPADDVTRLRSDAAEKSNETTNPYYGFTGDPKSPLDLRYYGYLDYAGYY